MIAVGRSGRRRRSLSTIPVACRRGNKLALRQKLRVSYLPFPAFNTDEKTVKAA
jgi:hypothetical protein